MNVVDDQRHTPERNSNTIADYVVPYLDDLRQRNFSAGTITGRRRQIQSFMGYCTERSIIYPADLTVSFIERYARYETSRISEMTGKKLSPVTAISQLSTLRSFTGYLVKRQAILFNPALEVELPKVGRRLPRNVLTANEAEQLMMVPDILDPAGIRNRAILELLYSTGMRRGELCKLDIPDIDFAGGTVFIRQAKGLVDRITPVGKRALAWVEKYLKDARPGFPGSTKLQALFLSSTKPGGRIRPATVTPLVSEFRQAAGILKSGATHMLRHTAATLMLENGADVRYVQQFLGHKELNSTQRYTHVAIKALSDVHARTHPANFEEETRKKQEEKP